MAVGVHAAVHDVSSSARVVDSGTPQARSYDVDLHGRDRGPAHAIRREFVSHLEESLTLVERGAGGTFNVTVNLSIYANVLFGLTSSG